MRRAPCSIDLVIDHGDIEHPDNKLQANENIPHLLTARKRNKKVNKTICIDEKNNSYFSRPESLGTIRSIPNIFVAQVPLVAFEGKTE